VLPAAEPLYRESQPDKLRLSSAFTLRGMRTKEFFSSAVVGISMAAAHIGALVAFYMIASHYGAWAPQEVNYSDSINTGFPWIAGIAIGLLASMNEEFTFRLFAIPYFTRVTKSRWIAIIVPAFLWGFLHSNYPQEPAYIRGLEVGLIGIVAGIVMLRWGILATLIWHYTVDASLVGLLLIRSDNLYFKISGVIVGLAAAAPLLFSVASYWKRRQFEPAEDLQNKAEPQPQVSFDVTEPSVSQPLVSGRYQPLTSGAIAILGICLVLGAVAALELKQERIGDYLKLSVNAKQATTLADNTLRSRGLNPSEYHHVALFLNNSDPAANEFLCERIGVPATNWIYKNQIPIALWGVRYFKDSDPEEYYVVLKSEGSLHSIHHTLAENTAGPSLSKEEAAALGEKFLREQKRVDLAGWSLVESNSKKRPHRTDHTLTWQQIAALDTVKDSPLKLRKNGTSNIGRRSDQLSNLRQNSRRVDSQTGRTRIVADALFRRHDSRVRGYRRCDAHHLLQELPDRGRACDPMEKNFALGTMVARWIRALACLWRPFRADSAAISNCNSSQGRVRFRGGKHSAGRRILYCCAHFRVRPCLVLLPKSIWRRAASELVRYAWRILS